MNRANYQAYLASRAWALKREAVRRRSGNRCERCWLGGMDAVHHTTYERIGDEQLGDLIAICDPCHGDQDKTIDFVCYSIGRLADAGAIPAGFALRVLHYAASQIPGDTHRNTNKINRAFTAGLLGDAADKRAAQ